MLRRGYVYIMTNFKRGTLYVGATSELQKRVEQHRNFAFPGFTKRYGLTRLVYVESHDWIADAAARETRLKRWRRAWKIELIEARNPDSRDLYDQLDHF